MKKFLSLSMLLVFALCASAQQRKTWDFTSGISDETLANLEADGAWTVTYNSDGTFKEAKDASKIFGDMTANGVVIPELSGIKFSNSGLSNSGNWIIGSNKFRIARKGSGFSLRVAPGQTITMKARSANKSKNNRGFQGDSNMEYISGPESGICIGSDFEAEGRDERGDFTLVWKVNENIEGLEGDSLDVTIKTAPDGGLDISLIQIDKGDGSETTENKVAYLYDSNYPGYDLSADAIHNAIVEMLPNQISDAKILDIDISTTQDVDLDSLRKLNVVVISNAINPATPYVNTIKNAIAYVPMLNLSTSLYETWGYGKAAQSESNILNIGAKAQESPIFLDEMGETILDEGMVALYYETPVAGYTVEEGSYFAKDSVWATTSDGIKAIHVHNNNRNAYMMLPTVFGKDADGTGVLEGMLPIAIDMLNKTKKTPIKTSKPSVVQDFNNQSTTVSLRCSTGGAVIYYTTDGTEPTMESPVYTEPFEITAAGVTVKAIAMADGYYLSDVTETVIDINELAKAPAISVAENDGYTEITLIPANDGEVVYYNFTGSDAVTASSMYEGTPITLTKHATITAFTAAHDAYLQSETTSQFVKVQNEKVRMDVVSHMDAKASVWTPASANPTYYNGKNGHAYYSDIIVTDADGNPVLSEEGDVTYQPANELVNVNPQNGWEVNTYAQAMFWQSNNPTHNVGDGGGYNPETALDDSNEATSGCLSFGKDGAANSDGITGPHYTGWIQSTEAFQGPFDLVSFISTTGSGAVDVFAYVTTDTLSGNWTELGKLETGTVKRLWKQTVLGYEGTDKVFVKVCGREAASVFDLYIKNEGELSKEYLTGIQNVNAGKAAEGEVIRTMVYSINGTQIDKLGKGINIIKEVYANGAVKTKKVMVK